MDSAEPVRQPDHRGVAGAHPRPHSDSLINACTSIIGSLFEAPIVAVTGIAQKTTVRLLASSQLID